MALGGLFGGCGVTKLRHGAESFAVRPAGRRWCAACGAGVRRLPGPFAVGSPAAAWLPRQQRGGLALLALGAGQACRTQPDGG
jgi:hypothetical protein